MENSQVLTEKQKKITFEKGRVFIFMLEVKTWENKEIKIDILAEGKLNTQRKWERDSILEKGWAEKI